MTDSREWEAVFWDIGGVILDLESVRRTHDRLVGHLIREFDLSTTPAAARETWRATLGDYFHSRDGTEFRPAREAYARAAEAVVGEPVPVTTWRSLVRRVSAEHMRPTPGAKATISRLARTGLHQGVVSDVDADEGRRILRQFDVHDYFDAVTTSEEVGRTKPDPAMFRTALERADADPERTLMVGDRYRHDMQGAANLGIHTVAFGADGGPAVDYAVSDLRELLAILDAD